jgi:acyl dehydratase
MDDRPVTGKWYEELTDGLVIRHAIRRTITEADNVQFTTMTAVMPPAEAPSRSCRS